jgi:spore maturation protein CgeB
MNILYVAMKYDYGDPIRGRSFEDITFRPALEALGHKVVHFDFMENLRSKGHARTQEALVQMAESCDVDLTFSMLFTDEILPSTIKKVLSVTNAPFVNWFADDHWRFKNFTSKYAPHLTLSITTDEDALKKYDKAGITNVLLLQWACNDTLFLPCYDEVYACDVSFVGQPHGGRRRLIEALRDNVEEVVTYGHGWPNGRLSEEAMVRLFSSSKISLNPGASSRIGPVQVATEIIRNQTFPAIRRPKQIKGRTFEIPGCRGFQLAEQVPYIEQYFVPDVEIVTYEGTSDLIEKTHFFLANEERRAEIARAGYERVRRDHLYSNRFLQIFGRLGL